MRNAASTIAGSSLIAWNSGSFVVNSTMEVAGPFFPDSSLAAFRTVSYSPTSRTANQVAIRLETDATSLEVRTKGTGSGGDLLFLVDGELASATPVQYPADGGLYLTRMDFGSSARRAVTILSGFPYFGGVRVPAGATVSAPAAAADQFRAIFIGDSFTEGPSSYAVQAAQLLGWEDARSSGVGGTGYLAAPAPKLTFRQRFDADVAAYAPQVLVIAGGINDGANTDAQIQAEAALLFDQVQAQLPDTLVFVLGPWNPRTAIRPGINAALKAAATGRRNFYWVPNYDDAWITGTGRVGAPMGDGNSDWVTSADGTHPSEAGRAYLGQKLAEAIKLLVA